MAALMAVHKGTATKAATFEHLLAGVAAFDAEVLAQGETSQATATAIGEQMTEFLTLKAGMSGNSEAMTFFQEIDEGLKAYYENVNTLANGAQFYKQMHQYLTSLQVFCNDFIASRTLEKNEIMNALKAGGQAPPGGAAAAGTFLGAPYQPPSYQ